MTELCCMCHASNEVMPLAGSGTVVNWICKNCAISRKIKVLPEYLENLENFGHWHRPLNLKYLPTDETIKTLVLLDDQSHIDHMMGEISEAKHKGIYQSWKKIRHNLDILLEQKKIKEEKEKDGRVCDGCDIVIIDLKKVKSEKPIMIKNHKITVLCVTCESDLKNCEEQTTMNFEQFVKRQRERMEIFKDHRPQEIAAMQLKENLS